MMTQDNAYVILNIDLTNDVDVSLHLDAIPKRIGKLKTIYKLKMCLNRKNLNRATANYRIVLINALHCNIDVY